MDLRNSLQSVGGSARSVQRYFHDNLCIATCAFFRDELLNLARATAGEDRILFAVDCPMASAAATADRIRPGGGPASRHEAESRAQKRGEAVC